MAKAKAATGSTSRVATLKKRAQYLRVRKGSRCATPAFVLEAKARSDEDRAPAVYEPRFGFTITRQVGKAVERNRIRRRLKAAVRNVGPDHAKGDFDYVLIARRPALTSEFAALVGELTKAFARVHRAPVSARPRVR
jgi:ribonuclease P protein component